MELTRDEEQGVRSEERAERGAGQTTYRRTITKGSMRDLYHRGNKTQKNSSVRLVVIILILALLIYLYLRF